MCKWSRFVNCKIASFCKSVKLLTYFSNRQKQSNVSRETTWKSQINKKYRALNKTLQLNKT